MKETSQIKSATIIAALMTVAYISSCVVCLPMFINHNHTVTESQRLYFCIIGFPSHNLGWASNIFAVIGINAGLFGFVIFVIVRVVVNMYHRKV